MLVVVINEEKTQTQKNRYNTLCFITNFLGEHQKIKKLFIRTGIVLKHGACDLKEVIKYGRRNFVRGIQKGV